jgi:cathepsin L
LQSTDNSTSSNTSTNSTTNSTNTTTNTSTDSSSTTTIDWVAAGKVSPIKNQVSCGAGWAFAATAAIESAHLISKSSLTNCSLSEQQLIDCSAAYGNNGCSSGSILFAFSYIKSKGILTTAQYPYTGTTGSCRSTMRSLNITTYNTASGTCTALINALTVQPIAVNVDASNWQSYQSGIFTNCSTTPSANHVVLVVGVNNNYWTLKNSWGISWGINGFMQLAPNNSCGLCTSPAFPIM